MKRSIYSDKFQIPAVVRRITGDEELHAVFQIDFLYDGRKYVEKFEMYLDERAENWIATLAVLVLETSIRIKERQKRMSELWGNGEC